MFRYQFELSGCEWADDEHEKQASEAWFELRCHKRGARCFVESLPAQLMVRSAPATDTLIISVLRKDIVLARSDDIDIGGVTRRVGVRTIPLRSAGTGAVVCSVRLMWSVEEEDGSVFAQLVKDRVAIGQQSLPTAISTLGGNNNNNSGSKVQDTSTKERVFVDFHREGTVLIEQQQGLKQVSSVNAEEKIPQSSDDDKKGAMWCVNTIQHAPEGFLDYYTTSTQVVKQPEAWCNLYTSPSPLLVAKGLHQEQQREMGSTCATSSKYGSCLFTFPFQGHRSAIEEIRRQPTKAADISADDLQHLLYMQKKNSLKWRMFVSSNRAYPTVSTRAR